MSEVSIQISKDIVTPIVEAKVKEALLEAMGGKDQVVASVVNEILNRKVDYSGKVSAYSSDNKFSWLDIVVTNQIKQAVEVELKEIIVKSSESIKNALVKQLQSKKGSETVAAALLDGLNKTFTSVWTSQISVAINPKSKD
jgi:hypothetical protein